MQLTKSQRWPINNVIPIVTTVILIAITTLGPVINGQPVVERWGDDSKTIKGEQFGNCDETNISGGQGYCENTEPCTFAPVIF
jgi:hypothetical protein